MKTNERLLTVAIVAIFSQLCVAQKVDKGTAFDMINRYEKSSTGLVKGHYYGSTALTNLLKPGYVSETIIFQGIDENDLHHIFFKRVDVTGKITDLEFTVDNGMRCPPYCEGCNPPCRIDFIASIGKPVDEAWAQQVIGNYQATNSTEAFTFSKESLQQLLAEKDVQGIYFALARDTFNTLRLLAVGTNSQAEILWNSTVLESGTVSPLSILPSTSIR